VSFDRLGGCASVPPAWPTWSSERDVEVGDEMWRWSFVVVSTRTREWTPPAIGEELRGVASVAVVKATDLRQGYNATERGSFDRARFGASLVSDRWVREPW
jgi:hypothetical protein